MIASIGPRSAAEAERRAVGRGELLAGFSSAGVVVQGAAAALRRAESNLAAVASAARGPWPGSSAGRRRRRAAGEQGDPRPPLALGRQHLRQPAVVRLQPRQHVLHLPQRLRQQPEQAELARAAGRGRSVAAAGRAPGPSASRPRVRGQVEQHEPLQPRQRLRRRAVLAMCDAERLDQLAVLHAGRTGRLAGPAVEAQVEVAAHLVVELRAGRR